MDRSALTLLWLLVINDILLRFENIKSKLAAYVDALVITISGLYPNLIRYKMERTL